MRRRNAALVDCAERRLHNYLFYSMRVRARMRNQGENAVAAVFIPVCVCVHANITQTFRR